MRCLYLLRIYWTNMVPPKWPIRYIETILPITNFVTIHRPPKWPFGSNAPTQRICKYNDQNYHVICFRLWSRYYNAIKRLKDFLGVLVSILWYWSTPVLCRSAEKNRQKLKQPGKRIKFFIIFQVFMILNCDKNNNIRPHLKLLKALGTFRRGPRYYAEREY